MLGFASPKTKLIVDFASQKTFTMKPITLGSAAPAAS